MRASWGERCTEVSAVLRAMIAAGKILGGAVGLGASLAALAACGSESGVPTRAGSGGGAGAGTDDGGAGGAGGFGGAGEAGIAGNSGSEVGGTGGMGLPDGPPCAVGDAVGVCIDVEVCVGDYAPTPGFCEGPANVQCCTALGAGACHPETVPQPNLGLVEPPGVGGCPAGMVPVATFCIDRVEAALVRTSDGGPVSPYFNPEMASVRAVAIPFAVPQAYIHQEQASDACLNSGKRLCETAEWLRACQGPATTTYPYGDKLLLGLCNDHRAVHPAVELFGTTDSWIFSQLDNACLNQLPLSLALTGSLPGCETAEGALDMMGNLHEWTADPAGTFRGGFYVDTQLNGPGCLYATTAHNTLHWDYSTGFRCCADP
ncbi:MAG: hypothetical protein EXR75_13470 [Myxococcales bacterium]|nr:hypothetical protein [Myxococcales bacterium]